MIDGCILGFSSASHSEIASADKATMQMGDEIRAQRWWRDSSPSAQGDIIQAACIMH